MKNKKGFTLIELLATLAIIALIAAIAVPNIVGLSNGIRQDNMLDDAKKLISLAKYQVNKDYATRTFANIKFCNGSSCTFKFEDLNDNGDIGKDPDGGEYDKVNSQVTYSVVTVDGTKVAKYCVILIGEHRTIGSAGNCVEEDNLYSRSNVVDK